MEASNVIATRLSALSEGGDDAAREFDLMFSEKAEAAVQLQAKLAKLGARVTPALALQTTLDHYRAKVAANYRRLAT
jgi:hypothetical protein